jgi:hypothetical protein
VGRNSSTLHRPVTSEGRKRQRRAASHASAASVRSGRSRRAGAVGGFVGRDVAGKRHTAAAGTRMVQGCVRTGSCAHVRPQRVVVWSRFGDRRRRAGKADLAGPQCAPPRPKPHRLASVFHARGTKRTAATRVIRVSSTAVSQHASIRKWFRQPAKCIFRLCKIRHLHSSHTQISLFPRRNRPAPGLGSGARNDLFVRGRLPMQLRSAAKPAPASQLEHCFQVPRAHCGWPRPTSTRVLSWRPASVLRESE